jgi:hypothetical protein
MATSNKRYPIIRERRIINVEILLNQDAAA